MTSVTNALLSELQILAREFNKLGIEPIIGGGMGLYLRQTMINLPETGRYDIVPPLRPTQDIDTFITGDVIVDGQKWSDIRSMLDSNGWTPDDAFLYGHFLKNVEGTDQTIKLDLLSSIPNQAELVRVKGPRIKPSDSSAKMHARVAVEAAGIELNAITLLLDNGSTIRIPSSFNFLILKLHAFRDSIDEERKQFGKHHALDIFRTTLMMRPEDWDAASEHLGDHSNEEYVVEAKRVCGAFFGDATEMGVIRIKENERYQTQRAEYDAYIEPFLEDLSDLFELD